PRPRRRPALRRRPSRNPRPLPLAQPGIVAMTARFAAAILAALAVTIAAAIADPVEADYYPVVPIPNPDNLALEVGAIECVPDGRVFAVTRRGDVYVLHGGMEDDLSGATLSLFASGLHECLGAVWKDNALYVTQRPEIPR